MIMFVTGYFGVGSVILLVNQSVTGQLTLGLWSAGLLIFPIVIGIMIYGGMCFEGFRYDRFVVWMSLTFLLMFVWNIALCDVLGRMVMIVMNLVLIVVSFYVHQRWVVCE